MKTKRLVQHTLAFLCFTIASCSKNKPCVGSKTRKESTKQVSIKVLTAEINPSTASSTNPSTTTSSQVSITEGAKPNDNPSSSISTPNTSSSALYSSATKAELATIVQSFPVGHNLGSNDPIAVLNYVLSGEGGKAISCSPSEEYGEFCKAFSILIYRYAEAVDEAEKKSLLNKVYTYKGLVKEDYNSPFCYDYSRAEFLQLAIIVSKIALSYKMEDTRRSKKREVRNFIEKRNIEKGTIKYWKEIGIELDNETIDYWSSIVADDNKIKKLINLKRLKTLQKPPAN